MVVRQFRAVRLLACLFIALAGVLSSVPSAAQTITTTVATGFGPGPMAVNPVTNQIYVANLDNSGGGVTVIDGATNSTTAVTLGFFPAAVAVNPATNKIYAVDNVSGAVAVIDGATNNTTTIGAGLGDCRSSANIFPPAVAAAVNPVTNKIYVVSNPPQIGNNPVFVSTIKGVARPANGTLQVADSFGALLVNQATRAYTFTLNDAAAEAVKRQGIAGDRGGTVAGDRQLNGDIHRQVPTGISGCMMVIDGATNDATTVGLGFAPGAVAVNPVTNKIYAAGGIDGLTGGRVTVIDGATNNTTTVSAGIFVSSVAVNPVTNRIYANSGAGGGVTVIDGATNNTATVAFGLDPAGVAVNPVTNKIYAANGDFGPDAVTVIDGATNNTTTVGVGHIPIGVVVNPTTNQVYVFNLDLGTASNNTVTVIDGATNSATIVTTGLGPDAVAVNPTTNNIYIANGRSNNVTVIDVPFNFASTATSQTVAAGGTATYNVTLNSVSGFAGQVGFDCTGAPGGATCAVSPNPATLSASATSVPLTVTVTNAANARAIPSPFKAWPAAFAGAFALLLAGARRRRKQAALVALAVFLVTGLGSCGGGSSGGSNPTTPAATTLTVTGTSGANTNSIVLSLTVTH